MGFPSGTSGRKPTCQCRRYKRPGFDPWVRKIPQRRKWQPTSVFLPGESLGQRSLVGYSPWGRKELGMTEQLTALHCSFQNSLVTVSIHCSSFYVLNLSILFYISKNTLLRKTAWTLKLLENRDGVLFLS